jgi:CxxC-x17-CxxC domain-containing protein
MKDFKRGFNKGGNRGGFGGGRPSFNKGGFGGGDRGGATMHHAICVKCGKDAEVPFKPNGKKPIYCSDCFVKDDAGGDRGFDRGRGRDDRGGDRREFRSRDSFNKPSFEKKSFDRPFPPREDAVKNSEGIVRQLTALGQKMDTLIDLMKASQQGAETKPKKEVKAAPAKPVAKEKPAKKAVKKSAKK